MKKLLYFLSVLILSLALPVKVMAQQPDLKTVVVEKDQVIDSTHLTAGEEVRVYGTVNGDLYVAGGNVVVDGAVSGDLMVAGGNVEVSGTVSQDLRVAGGQVMVSGQVGQNLTAMGGNVRVTPTSKINGSLVSVGGNVVLKSPVSSLHIVGGNVELDSQVNGDVKALVGRLSLTPSAVVEGNLTYWSDQEAVIASGAEVKGKTLRKEPHVSGMDKAKLDELDKQVAKLRYPFKFGLMFFRLISSLLVGLLVVKFYPNLVDRGLEQIKQKPWQSLGVGFLAVLVAPMALLLLLLTIAGVSLAVILAIVYGLLIYFAKFMIAYWAGSELFNQMDKKPKPGWKMVVGLLVYYLLTVLPLVGFLVKLSALFTGVGALVVSKREAYLEARKKKIY